MPDSRLRALRAHYGSYGAILRAPDAAVGTAAAAARRNPDCDRRAAAALRAIVRTRTTVVTELDLLYPAALRHLHDPPHVLFLRGKFELLDQPAVAIVGARHHTAYGADAARQIAAELSAAGLVVVSGMARGIDCIAHQAALPGGSIGVLGCGIDVVYPSQNAPLFRQMVTDGLLLTEFAPGTPALRYHFPQRNRLIAALSAAVVVVEASAKSGTLITAEHALELGREVFAVPGPIGSDASIGTNALIREGATLVTGADDVLAALGMAQGPRTPRAAARPPSGVSPDAERVWGLLGGGATHVDRLMEETALAPAEALGALLELELRGAVRQLPGKFFALA